MKNKEVSDIDRMILQKIEVGLKQSKQKKTKSTIEAKKELEKWLK